MKITRYALVSILLTMTAPALVHAQGLNLSDIGLGHATATPSADNHTSIDISGDAAKVIFAQVKADFTSRKYDGRNPRGEVVDEVFVNGGISCTRSLLFETTHCAITMIKGRVVGSH